MRGQPVYHRLLRLRHYRPRPVMTAVLFEGSIVVPVLLSLAEILDWWSVLAVPVAVAAMVKFNDVALGLPYRPSRRQRARGVARVPTRPSS
jgi:hypothetical protein